MRALCLILLLGCTSTRQLSSPADPRLHAPVTGDGVVVATTTRWKERLDPNTQLRLRSEDGRWTDRLVGRELYVDAHGLWVGSPILRIAQYADAVELVGATPALLDLIERHRPAAGALRQDGDAWTLVGDPAVLGPWLGALEQALAGVDPLEGVDAQLASIRVHTLQQGWRAPLFNSPLLAGLRIGVTTKVGWRWDEVAAIEVENLSGGKTLAATVGSLAGAVIVLPAALLLGGAGGSVGGTWHPSTGGGHSGGGFRVATRVVAAVAQAGQGGAQVRGTWDPELAGTESVRARPMFSTGARVRSVIRPTLALDTFAANTRDLVGSGLIAKARFLDVFELGGGVRLVGTRDERGWRSSVTHVFAAGVNLPLDAARRFAVPLGFEATGGGTIAHDVRFPWGLRYAPAGGRWFGTLSPATPTWMRKTSEQHGRWTVNGSVELGIAF